MRVFRTWWRPIAVAGTSLALDLICSPASAHIKWFCAFNVAGQPRGLENVLCTDFELLMSIALLTLLSGYLIEMTAIGTALLAALDRVTGALRDNAEILMRAACGFFFVALWAKGGIILTPELTTDLPLVSWLQLCFAASLVWRRTMPIAGLGIFGLFSYALAKYGLFHLMDYPIFLGIGTYFILVGLGVHGGARPLDLLRWSAAITLMWASVEKWAYPQWTFPLILTHPQMTLGYSAEFFMRAAGMIEFTLSFALLLTPLVRRASALVLCGMFVSAVVEFGKVDAIGHAPIIAVLLTIIGDDYVGARFTRIRLGIKEPLAKFNLRLSAWDLVLVPAGYCAALSTFLAVYYVLHAILFGTKIV
ncbi:MAG TPA: hypothetical protein VKV77_09385 [Methylovirgula sp.]|nr:hypothetical protein [Methylovirgula sp.]